jgi:hypothetical protein
LASAKRKKIAQEVAKRRCGARERERYIPSPPCCSFPIAADCIRRVCQCPGESTEGFRIIAYPGERLHLFAVADPAVVFPPSRFLRVAGQIRPGDMAVADFDAAHARQSLCPIRASAVQAVGYLMIDLLHFTAGLTIVRHGHAIGIEDNARLNP